MRNDRGSLYNRLQAIEARFISPIDKRVSQLSDSHRQQYESWRAACKAQIEQYEPSEFYRQRRLQKIKHPPLHRHVSVKLFDDLPATPPTASTRDIAEIWYKFRDRTRL